VKRLPRLIECRLQLARLAAKRVPGVGGLGQFGIELCLTFGPERGSRRHHRTTLLLRVLVGRLCQRQLFFEFPALRNFLFELRVKVRVTPGGLFGSAVVVTECTLVGGGESSFDVSESTFES